MPFLGKTPTKLLDANVNIDGGNIDGTTIGATSAASATVTTFTSTGIDDNATSTAITIDASQNVTFASKATVGYSRAAGTGGIVLYDDDQAENRLTLLTGGGTGINAVINQAGGSLNITDASLNAVATFNEGGNVGIGTTSPSNPLHINSGATTVAQRIDTNISSTEGNVDFLQAYTTNGYASSLNLVREGTTNTGLAFKTTGSGTLTERMRITSDGNVWIGGTFAANSQLAVSKGTAAGLEVICERTVGGTVDTGAVRFLSYDRTGLAFTDLAYDAAEHIFGNGSTERMRIDTSGNVGIGTSSPDTPLHVLTNSSGYAITIEENSGTEAFQIGVDSVGSLDFFNTKAGTSHLSLVDNGDTIITGGGNVGIGTSSPAKSLHVYSANSGGTTTPLVLQNNGTTGTVVELRLAPSAYDNDIGSTARWSAIQAINGGSGNPTSLAFLTNNISSDPTERMRIDSSGRLLIGKTATSNSSNGYFLETGSGGYASFVNSATASSNRNILCNRHGGNGDTIQFRRANVQVGSISVTTSATTYNTSSDARLKENIVNASSASDDIDAIQVRSFNWKADGSHQKYGMVAQELVTVAPEAVTQPEDSEEMMSVDYSKLVPMMIKEIQDLRARVAQLEGA